MKTCPYCAYANREGVLFCEECGHPFVGVAGTQATSRLAPNDQPQSVSPRVTWGTARFEPDAEILIRVRDHPEPIRLTTKDEILLGRADSKTSTFPDLDMGPFGAVDMGVSRRHALIRRGEDTLTLTDLGSTNGTHLNGQRLIPNQPRVLRDGDEIRMGKLIFHLFFK